MTSKLDKLAARNQSINSQTIPQVFPGHNPSSKQVQGLTSGFQTVYEGGLARLRNFLRFSCSGTNANQMYDGVSQAALQLFRSSGITLMLEMAIINRTSSVPVIVKALTPQAHAYVMAASPAGGSYNFDQVVGCVTPNVGNHYRSVPDMSGAQLIYSGVITNPLSISLIDSVTNQPLTDLNTFYLSFVVFERDSPVA